MRHVDGRWCWLAATFAACANDSPLDLPAPEHTDVASVTEPPGSGLPGTDPVAGCDQAPDGTPCGAGGQHCIFGVCADNLCGDGVVAGSEQCDDGNDMDGDSCTADCRPGYVCRDGRLDPGEECDDGNRLDADACSNACRLVICGNERIDPGEECDDGNQSNADGCSQRCQLIECGNGRVDPEEACDGTQGCPEDGQRCRTDCTGCEQDRCRQCAEQRCRSYEGIDVFAGCRVAVDPSAQVAGMPIAGFIEKCTRLDDCVAASACADPALGPVTCFCGGLSVDSCQQSESVPPGPCAPLYFPATGCEAGEGANNCVLQRFIDLTLPSGWSNYLAFCRDLECKPECTP